MTGSWYVLTEEGRVDFQRRQCCYQQEWQLTRTQHVEGDRQEAEAAGLRVAKTHVPEGFHLYPGDTPRRSVFVLREGSWLVSLGIRQAEVHFRVSVGELVHTAEESTAPRPAPVAGRGHHTLAWLKFLVTGSF
ncbi:hypothetical protein ACIQNU_40850 [Streptomyces sp. NPDC091292]|uniref:hypothetical protein n=1 Tax=Streptomyces sp. NPDC091292 TaxID=3365991 RepID=UPI0037FDCDA9